MGVVTLFTRNWVLVCFALLLAAPTHSYADEAADRSSACRAQYAFLNGSREAFGGLRWRFGLAVAGHSHSPLAALLTLPQLRPLERALTPALSGMQLYADSPDFRRALQRFGRGVPERFREGLLTEIFKSPNTEKGLELLRRLGEAGVDTKDYEILCEGLGTIQGDKARAAEFTTRAERFIYERLGNLPSGPPMAEAPTGSDRGPRPRNPYWEKVFDLAGHVRWRIGLLLAGRSHSPTAELLTLPELRPYESKLARFLPEFRAMATRSPEFVTAFRRFARGISGSELETLLDGLFQKDPEEDLILFRSLGTVGVSSQDFAALVDGLNAQKSPKDQGKEFRKRAALLIATRIGNSSRAINKLFDVTEGLDQSTSGNLFENWLRQNYFVGTKRLYIDIEKMQAKIGSGDGQFSGDRQIIKSDGLIEERNSYTLVEMKHLRTSQNFQPDQLSQASDYAKLIRDQVKYPIGDPNGKPIRKIVYVFSSRAAAEKNRAELVQRLGSHAEIRYLDRERSEMVTLQTE